MKVFTCKNWTVCKETISGQIRYFIDDQTGKNHRVFKTLDRCKRWIMHQIFEEVE